MPRLLAALLAVASLSSFAGAPRKVTPEHLQMVEGSADYTRTLKLVLEHAGDRLAVPNCASTMSLACCE